MSDSKLNPEIVEIMKQMAFEIEFALNSSLYQEIDDDTLSNLSKLAFEYSFLLAEHWNNDDERVIDHSSNSTQANNVSIVNKKYDLMQDTIIFLEELIEEMCNDRFKVHSFKRDYFHDNNITIVLKGQLIKE